MSPSDKSSTVTSDEVTVTPVKTKEPKPQSVKSAPHATHATVEQVAQNTHNAVDKLAEVANSAATTFGDKTSGLQDTRTTYIKQVRAQIKNSPMGSMAIAVIGGFLVGWLLA